MVKGIKKVKGEKRKNFRKLYFSFFFASRNCFATTFHFSNYGKKMKWTNKHIVCWCEIETKWQMDRKLLQSSSSHTHPTNQPNKQKQILKLFDNKNKKKTENPIGKKKKKWNFFVSKNLDDDDLANINERMFFTRTLYS